jgi:branched-chain amino acid transport system substrate-binding protein
LLYFPLSYPESSALIVRQAKDIQDLDSLLFIGSEGMISEAFIDAVGEDGIGVYLPGPAPINNPENNRLRADYEAHFGEPPPAFYYTFTYDAVNLLLDTIEAVAIQEEDGTLHIGRQALRDALYATEVYPRLTGPLTCDEFGDCGAAQFNIVRLDDPAAGLEGLRRNVVYTSASEDD